jgi:O-antigen/teichoic acid export membrane protein
LDQGLTSGAGFLLNLFLARWLTGVDYGAFAVGFATLLFLSGYHNVLTLEPMTVLGPARYSTEMTAYLSAQLKCNAVLVACLAGLMLLTAAGMRFFGEQPALVAATAASGLALPFVLLFWMVRRMCYVVQRPALAVSASAGYFVLVVAALFALRTKGWLDSSVAFLLMGVASVFSAIFPLRELGLLRTGGAGTVPWKRVGGENWNYGRWLMASTTLFSISSQAQTYLVAAMMGLAAAGILRAIQIPALVMTQIVTATSLLVLPSMSYEFGMGRGGRLRKKAVLSSIGLSGLALSYTLLLWLFARPLEHILFGGKFSEHAWLIPVLGLVPVCTGFSLGFSMALRASQKPQFDLLANSVAAPIGLITALIFIKVWGIGGAAFSLVAGTAASALVFFTMYLRQAKDQ